MNTSVKIIGLLTLICGLITGCDSPPPVVSGLRCSLDEGWLISDDVFITNENTKNLTEVHVTMTLTGEKGDKREITRYWAIWHSGEQQKISIPASESVIKIQRVELSGKCGQGSIGYYWTKK